MAQSTSYNFFFRWWMFFKKIVWSKKLYSVDKSDHTCTNPPPKIRPFCDPKIFWRPFFWRSGSKNFTRALRAIFSKAHLIQNWPFLILKWAIFWKIWLKIDHFLVKNDYFFARSARATRLRPACDWPHFFLATDPHFWVRQGRSQKFRKGGAPLNFSKNHKVAIRWSKKFFTKNQQVAIWWY